jgi:hypothetical protein
MCSQPAFGTTDSYARVHQYGCAPGFAVSAEPGDCQSPPSKRHTVNSMLWIAPAQYPLHRGCSYEILHRLEFRPITHRSSRSRMHFGFAFKFCQRHPHQCLPLLLPPVSTQKRPWFALLKASGHQGANQPQGRDRLKS